MEPLWTGPCEIMERIGNTGRYRVETPHGPEDLHMDSFKTYLAPATGKAIPCWYYKPAERLPERDTDVIEKILKHRMKNGRHEWLVRWEGHDAKNNTWEPASSFVGQVQQDWVNWNKEKRIQVDLQDVCIMRVEL